MENKNIVVKAWWLAALLFVLAGALMLLKGKPTGATFLALGSMFMIFAIATAKKSEPKE